MAHHYTIFSSRISLRYCLSSFFIVFVFASQPQDYHQQSLICLLFDMSRIRKLIWLPMETCFLIIFSVEIYSESNRSERIDFRFSSQFISAPILFLSSNSLSYSFVSFNICVHCVCVCLCVCVWERELAFAVISLWPLETHVCPYGIWAGWPWLVSAPHPSCAVAPVGFVSFFLPGRMVVDDVVLFDPEVVFTYFFFLFLLSIHPSSSHRDQSVSMRWLFAPCLVCLFVSICFEIASVARFPPLPSILSLASFVVLSIRFDMSDLSSTDFHHDFRLCLVD